MAIETNVHENMEIIEYCLYFGAGVKVKLAEKRLKIATERKNKKNQSSVNNITFYTTNGKSVIVYPRGIQLKVRIQ